MSIADQGGWGGGGLTDGGQTFKTKNRPPNTLKLSPQNSFYGTDT